MALTPRQAEELRGAIESRREMLLAEIHEEVERARGEPYGELAGPAPDAGDQSVAALISDLDHADLSRDTEELRGLEAARTRLTDGSYGICAACGGDIGFERLRANPGAVRCVECQRLHEKTYAGSAGSSL